MVIDKFIETRVIAPNAATLHSLVNGEVRVIIQKKTKKQRDKIGKCQFKGCNKTKLQTAHHHNYKRAEMFKEIAEKHSKKLENGLYEYSIYEILLEFINEHDKEGRLYFLCEHHHKKYDSKGTNKEEFIKSIEV